MNKNFLLAPFLLGSATVAWIAIGFVPGNPLALLMTLVIFAVFVIGARELHAFRQQTAALESALGAIPEQPGSLDAFLDQVPAALRHPVRLRIEGERSGLPGPSLTPYLVGLLVTLGMLGTFLGMVATFKGAGYALESTTDFQAIRSSLTAPIKGLGLAFGTSVAGVAASAMLGLMSALCRRERQRAAHSLDASIATTLRLFSLAHQRQETYRALQLQTQLLPAVVDKLETMMTTLERQSQLLGERLLGNQESFQREIKGVYGELARHLDASLRTSLADCVRAAGECIKPVAEAALSGIAREAAGHHENLLTTTQAQLDGLIARIAASVATDAAAREAAQRRQERASENLLGHLGQTMSDFSAAIDQRSSALLASLNEAQARTQAGQASAEQQRHSALTQSLEAMAATLQREWQAAGSRNLAQQREICTVLETTARDISERAKADASATLAEVGRLLETAAAAPRAAADVIVEMRQQHSAVIARDNEVLAERSRIMEALTILLDAVNRTATEQRDSTLALAASSEALLGRIGEQFAARADTESARLAAAAARIDGSAIEVASLADAFNLGVQLFGDANGKLIESLQRIEAALDKSTARSDEQLAYYVAQAREIIDLSLLSQKGLLNELGDLKRVPAPLAPAVPEAA